jgi:CesT_Tir_1
MMTREEVESYFLRMGLDFEEVEDGLWVIRSTGEGATVVANYSPPLLLLRLKVMDLPVDHGDVRLGAFYRRLLELNAGDILHGSYGIEENEVVLSDALELETMDFSELRSSYESMALAASTHFSQLAELVPVPQEG